MISGGPSGPEDDAPPAVASGALAGPVRHAGRGGWGALSDLRRSVSRVPPSSPAPMRSQLLSRRGWLDGGQVQPGDICLTLNTGTGLAEWQPVQAVNVFGGPHDAVQWKPRSHSSVTTLDHRWPVWLAGRPGCRDVWRWRTTQTFPLGGRIGRASCRERV